MISWWPGAGIRIIVHALAEIVTEVKILHHTQRLHLSFIPSPFVHLISQSLGFIASRKLGRGAPLSVCTVETPDPLIDNWCRRTCCTPRVKAQQNR
jgi:hypothetical protein